MDIDSGEVDFDFFETPREDSVDSSKSKSYAFDSKPPNPSLHRPKHDMDKNNQSHVQSSKDDPGSSIAQNKPCRNGNKDDYSDDSYSDFDSDSDTPRNEKQQVKINKNSRHSSEGSSLSDSSSAYSNSDYSSDEETKPNQGKKEKIAVHIPKAQEAWSQDYEDNEENSRRNRKDDSSDGESDTKNADIKKKRVKSANPRKSSSGKQHSRLKSSGSFSNNSDITDVSPLESPENSPRGSKRNGKIGRQNVQYRDIESPERQADIKLESEEIDLSILMKCMADIDREKQERLKSNSRRVMFAPPTVNEKRKGNYTFSDTRAKMIEKENQRLLKQIMSQMHSGPGKYIDASASRGPRRPKKATEPVIQRLTPSAVNRMREQRRIESENMHILKRLQTVRPTQGMSKHEQLTEFERQMSYGIPTGTLVIQDHDQPRRAYSVMSHTSTNRSRPSSAKSHTSTSGAHSGRRSRPSSAKSNASLASNASMRSNVSKRSTMSIRSNMSVSSVRKKSDGKIDHRPLWDDRFSYS